MNPSKSSTVDETTRSLDISNFVQLIREFLTAHAELRGIFSEYEEDKIPFAKIRALVGDDDRAVLFRLKEKSHALYRAHGLATRAVRREALFDLAVGSLFHEAMKLRETLYQREVYAPRVASLRAAADLESDELFDEFDRILGKSVSRLGEVVSEVRALLVQTRDQLRRLLIARSGDRLVTRCLLSRRAQVDATFPEGFSGLLEAMHGNTVTGLVEGARALLESAYFGEAKAALDEAGEDLFGGETPAHSTLDRSVSKAFDVTDEELDRLGKEDPLPESIMRTGWWISMHREGPWPFGIGSALVGEGEKLNPKRAALRLEELERNRKDYAAMGVEDVPGAMVSDEIHSVADLEPARFDADVIRDHVNTAELQEGMRKVFTLTIHKEQYDRL